ncbi:energy transducer TonB, partial [Limnospira fusiformis CCALA 023]
IYRFVVNQALEQGLSLAEVVDEEALEVLREEYSSLLIEFYGVENVETLSTNVVLDFIYGGLSRIVDYDYFRFTFTGDVEATFGVESISEVTKLQIVEYLYEQEVSVSSLHWFNVEAYLEEHGSAAETAIAQFFRVSSINELSVTQIRDFALNIGVQQFSIEGALNIEYIRETFNAAIVSSDLAVNAWLESFSFLNVDTAYVQSQLEGLLLDETLTLEQVNEILGTEIDSLDGLTDRHLITLVFDADFQEIIGDVEIQLFQETLNIDYVRTVFASAIAHTLEVDITAVTGEEVLTVPNEQLDEFLLAQSEEIATELEIDADNVTLEVAQEWFITNSVTTVEGLSVEVDIAYIKYQLQQSLDDEQISLEDINSVLDEPVEEFDELTDQQIVTLGRNAEFQSQFSLEISLVQTELSIGFVVSQFSAELADFFGLSEAEFAAKEFTQEEIIEFFSSTQAQAIAEFLGETVVGGEDDDDLGDDQDIVDESNDDSDDDDQDIVDESNDDSDDDDQDDDSDDSPEFAAEDVLAYIEQVDVETVIQIEEIDIDFVTYQVGELFQASVFSLEDVNTILETEYESVDELTTEDITTLAFSVEFQEVLGEDFEIELVQSEVNYSYLRASQAEAIAALFSTEENPITVEDVLRGEIEPLTDAEILAAFEENFLTADVGFIRYQVEQLLAETTITIEQVNESLSLEESVEAIVELNDAQIINLVYNQEFQALLMEAEQAIELSAINYEAFIEANAETLIAQFEVDDVTELTLEQVHGFMFSGQVSIEGFVNFDYLRETFISAIASQELADSTVLDWFNTDFSFININFLNAQFNGFTAEVQTQLLDSLGIELSEAESLSHQQLIQIFYSSEFQAITGIETLQTLAFDWQGYAQANAEALADFYQAFLVPAIPEGQAPNSVVVELSNFTGEQAQVTVTLEEVEGGIQVTVDSVEPIADINGVFFNIEDSSLLDSLSVTGDDVTNSSFSGDVKRVRNTSISPLKFDAGVQIGTPGIGQDDIQSTVFVITADGEELSLDQFVGQEFGVRLTSVQSGGSRSASSKLRGTAEAVFTADGDDVGVIDVSSLSAEQVLNFAFGQGWQSGIDPTEFVEVDFQRQQFAVEIARAYNIDVSEVASLESSLVLDYIYGGLSSQIDFEFYRTKYAASLESTFGMSAENLTRVQILEHAYTVGLEQGFNFVAIDYNAIAAQYPQVFADFFDIPVEEIFNLDLSIIQSFDLGIASELGIDITQFVDIEFFRQQASQQILQNYRIENVFRIDSQQLFEFSLQGDFSTAPTIDLNWAMTQYADILAENLDDFDQDGDGNIDNSELFDALTGQLLEAGNETSDIYSFEQYFESEDVQEQVAEFFGVESFEDVTFTQRLEYMFGAGLQAGIDPYSEEFLEANPQMAMEIYLEENSTALIEFAGVGSINQVTFLDVYNFQAINEINAFSGISSIDDIDDIDDIVDDIIDDGDAFSV